MLATVLKTVNPTYLVDNISRLVYYLLHVSDTTISYKNSQLPCLCNQEQLGENVLFGYFILTFKSIFIFTVNAPFTTKNITTLINLLKFISSYYLQKNNNSTNYFS